MLLVGGRILLQKLKRKAINEVKDYSLTFLRIEQIMEDDERKRNVIKAEDNDYSTYKLERIRD